MGALGLAAGMAYWRVSGATSESWPLVAGVVVGGLGLLAAESVGVRTSRVALPCSLALLTLASLLATQTPTVALGLLGGSFVFAVTAPGASGDANAVGAAADDGALVAGGEDAVPPWPGMLCYFACVPVGCGVAGLLPVDGLESQAPVIELTLAFLALLPTLGRAEGPVSPATEANEPADVPPPSRVAEIARHRGLTGREEELLRLLAEGRSLPYAARELGVSENTAKTHAKSLYQKLGVHTRQELLDYVQGPESPY